MVSAGISVSSAVKKTLLRVDGLRSRESLPLIVTQPEEGSRSEAARWRKVVLPAPFSPSRRYMPSSIDKEIIPERSRSGIRIGERYV